MNSRAEAGPSCVDLATVDLLARLHLYGRRRGLELRLRRAPRELTELLDLCGLREVLGAGSAGGQAADTRPENRVCLRQPLGNAEEREERLRVEEERQLGDPPA